MKKYCLVCVCCLLLYGYTMQAQNPFAKFKVEHYDTKKGLPGDYVMNVYQSKEGFIWTNGYSGYTRFDGKRFVTFSSKNVPAIKADNNVALFTETADSSLWFATASSGLLAYNKGKFKAYLTEFPNLFLTGKSRLGELIISLGGFRSDRYLFFNPEKKTYRITGADELTHALYTRLTNNDTTVRRWTILGNKVYHLNDANQPVLLGEKEGINGDNTFSTFMVDSKHRTWMMSERGLYLWNGQKMIHYPGTPYIAIVPSNPSFGLMTEDNDRGIWASTGSGGLAYLPDGDSVFHVFPKEYLNIQTVNNVAVDREGSVWVATDRGLFKLSKTKVINYTSAEGIENNRVSAICQMDSNSFLVANFYNKIYELKNGNVNPFAISNEAALKAAAGVCYYSFVDQHYNAWLCCNRLIYKINKNEQKTFQVDGEVRYACTGIDGKVYFGVAYKGIGFINEKGVFEYLPIKAIDFVPLYLSSIRQLNDGTWVICSFRTGVYFISPDGRVKNIDITEGVKGIQVFNSYIDPAEPDALWFATGAGLVKYKGGKKSVIGANTMIPDLTLFGILPDKNGRWWLPTNTGVISVRKSQLDSFILQPSTRIDWEIIDEGDGMNNRQCVGARHSIVSVDGRIMVLGIGGLIEIDPASIRKNTVVPLASINQLLVDDSVYYSGRDIIPPGNHRYIFDYSALSFIAPEKNKIKFRLAGYDDKWINSVGDQRAFYTNLSPGDYHFEVMVSNNDGVWSTGPASFSFYVKPFFYQTTWFKIAIIVLSLIALWLIIRWRTAASRSKNIWLEKQVSLRTAELESSNKEIFTQKQEIEQALEKLKQTQSQLIQSEKMASLGELTAGIAHEIQNPLNFVNNFSEINNELIEELKMLKPGNGVDGQNYEEYNDLLKNVFQNNEKINYHGKRADAIVKGMLQHSRSSSGQKEPTDINALCDEYLRLAYHACLSGRQGLRAKDKNFKVALKTDFDESVMKIKIIPQEIGRVLLNLYNNAFYAVSEKSRDAKPGFEPTVSVSTKRQSNNITITVTDNGSGIPQNIIDKIFQPFFTTKPTGEGTGLGLSLSYDIVKAHGGELTVKALKEEGSQFTILLPV
ncbi:MAG: ATP-binding protein [Chitinophagaceae bacterium]